MTLDKQVGGRKALRNSHRTSGSWTFNGTHEFLTFFALPRKEAEGRRSRPLVLPGAG